MKRRLIHFLLAACVLMAGKTTTGPTRAMAVAEATGPAKLEPTKQVPLADPPLTAELPAETVTEIGRMLKKLRASGGISAGEFYASNPGPDSSSKEIMLSNFLFEISNRAEVRPVSFEAALGETSTPNLLAPPEATGDLDLEYASLALHATARTSIEVGLLKPNAGYEDTYTYNNANLVLGAVASQQPYNATGLKLAYAAPGLRLNLAYYGKRLDESEYTASSTPVDNAWEAGIGTNLGDTSCRLFYYRTSGYRSLTGAVMERSFKGISFAIDLDWWRWNHSLPAGVGRRSALGGSFYAVPKFGEFSLPIRLEYIDQGSSGIYLANPDTGKIYTVTVSPTYRFTETSYLRFEAAGVRAREGFSDKDGRSKDNRLYLSTELGYLF